MIVRSNVCINETDEYVCHKQLQVNKTIKMICI